MHCLYVHCKLLKNFDFWVCRVVKTRPRFEPKKLLEHVNASPFIIFKHFNTFHCMYVNCKWQKTISSLGVTCDQDSSQVWNKILLERFHSLGPRCFSHEDLMCFWLLLMPCLRQNAMFYPIISLIQRMPCLYCIIYETLQQVI